MMMMMIPEKWGRPHQWHTRSQHFHLNKKERLFLDLTLDLRRDLRPPVSDLRLFCDCHSCRICQVGSDKEIMLTKTVILLLFFHFTGFECIMLTAVCNGDPGFFSFFILIEKKKKYNGHTSPASSSFPLPPSSSFLLLLLLLLLPPSPLVLLLLLVSPFSFSLPFLSFRFRSLRGGTSCWLLSRAEMRRNWLS